MTQHIENKVNNQEVLGNIVIANIKNFIEQSGINNNTFYKTFKSKQFDKETLKIIFQQYYYYIRTFPQILAGTSHATDNEFIRMQLSRTVLSELGDGNGIAHFIMFEKVLASLGVVLDDWKSARYIPEAKQLVDGLRHIFLEKSTYYAIGAHYVIEEFGFPMIVALYEGFRNYDGWKHEDFGYFYLHMLVESDHVAWISAAVLAGAQNETARFEIEAGAREVLTILSNFWAGLDRVATTGALHG